MLLAYKMFRYQQPKLFTCPQRTCQLCLATRETVDYLGMHEGETHVIMHVIRQRKRAPLRILLPLTSPCVPKPRQSSPTRCAYLSRTRTRLTTRRDCTCLFSACSLAFSDTASAGQAVQLWDTQSVIETLNSLPKKKQADPQDVFRFPTGVLQ